MKKWYLSKTAQKYIYPYIFVSFMTVILISLLYFFNNSLNLKQEANIRGETQLQHVKDYFDIQINTMENAAFHFSSFIQGHAVRDTDANYVNICNQLQSYHEKYPITSEIIYFSRETGNVYTTEDIMPYQKFQQSSEFGDELDMIAFYKRLKTVSRSKLISTRKVGMHPIGNYLIYISPVPYLDGQPLGTIAFIIDKSSFNKVIKDYFGEIQGYFFAFDSAYYTSYGLDLYGKIPFEQAEQVLMISNGTDIMQHKIGNEDFIIIRSISNSLGFTYVASIPYKVFYRAVWPKINIFLGIASALTAVMIILLLFIASKNLLPVKKLADNICSLKRNENEDIFEHISRGYEHIISQNNSLTLQVQDQNEFARKQLLENLIYGRLDDKKKLRAFMLRANIKFEYPVFFVVTVKIVSEDILGGQASQLVDYFGKIYFKYGKAYGTETNDSNTIAFLINAIIPEKLSEKDIRRETMELLNKQISDCNKENIILGAGRMQQELIHVDISYYEALTSMRDGCTYNYFESERNTGKKSIYPVSKCAMYRESLLHGNEEMALELLDSMIDDILEKNISFAIGQCFCFYIANTLIEVINKAKIELDETKLVHASANGKLSDFKRVAHEYTSAVCTEIARIDKKTHEKLADDLIEYINSHYGDYDISAETAADIFHLSEAYVRKIIKEETGYQFIDYITALRMNYIKQKLTETNIPIKELIAKIGYEDVSSFIRKFRSIEGITPGEYRKIYKNIKTAL